MSEVARYEVPGTRTHRSPLLVLSDDLEGFGLAVDAGASWGVVRLMLAPEAETSLAVDLMGAGEGPAEALLHTALQMLWAAEQRGESLDASAVALLATHAPLLGEDAHAAEQAQVVGSVLDRIDQLLRIAVTLGVPGLHLQEGVLAVLRGVGALPEAPDAEAPAEDAPEEVDETSEEQADLDALPDEEPSDAERADALLPALLGAPDAK